MHMTRFFGVLSSASKHRPQVVPTPEPDTELQPPLQLSLLQPDATAAAQPPPTDKTASLLMWGTRAWVIALIW